MFHPAEWVVVELTQSVEELVELAVHLHPYSYFTASDHDAIFANATCVHLSRRVANCWAARIHIFALFVAMIEA
jgi:hypothetical protein